MSLQRAGNARDVAEAKIFTGAPAEGGRQAVSEAINMSIASTLVLWCVWTIIIIVHRTIY